MKYIDSLKTFYEKLTPESILAISMGMLSTIYFVTSYKTTNSCCVDVTLEKVAPEPVFTSLNNTHTPMKVTAKEFNCLAKNIYYEAKFEGYLGKVSVAQITYNRLKSGKWGNDFCSVVYSPNQFSWTLFKKMRNGKPSGPKWKTSRYAASAFVNGLRVRNLEHSKFYHADYIKKPKWARKMRRVSKVGRHIFYVDNKNI